MPGRTEGQNLLSNSTFNTGKTGWTDFTVTSAWFDADINQLGNYSGSLQVTLSSAGAGFGVVGQCVSVTAGTRYNFGAKIFNGGGQAVAGGGYVQVVFYSGASCTGNSLLNIPSGRGGDPTGRWVGFRTSATAPAGSVSAHLLLSVEKDGAGNFTSYFDDAFINPDTSCSPELANLCLLARRFRVTVSARDQRTGNTGDGQSIPLNDLFGYFSLPSLTNDPANPELFVKLLDARTVNGRFWVFYGGLTDLEYTLTVTDTTNGQVRTYRKAPGTFEGNADTAAFPLP